MVKFYDPRENNFNLLRLLAASSVIFSHAYEIVGGDHDFFHAWIGYSGGWIAVSAFFSISGFLIFLSMVRGHSVRDFLVARCLRIFPGLWAMLLISVLILGFFISHKTPLEFFSSLDTVLYIVGNGLLYFPEYYLPGVFDDLPLSGVVNGSLWTLRFEFTCYLIVLSLFLFGFLRSSFRFIIFSLGYFVLHLGVLVYFVQADNVQAILYDGSGFAKLYRLFFAFFIGMVIARYVETVRIKFLYVLLSFVFCLITRNTVLFMSFLIIFIAMLLFWIAFLQVKWLVPFRTMPDYSYGIYVYAFPVQQVCNSMLPGYSATWNSILSLIVTIPFAAISWHFVESPCLRMKRIFTKNEVSSK